MRLKFLLLIGVVLFFAANPSEGNESTLIEVNGSDRLGVVFSIDCSRSMNELDSNANNRTQIAKDLVGLLCHHDVMVGLVTWGKEIERNDLTQKFDDINESLDNIPKEQKASNLDLGLRDSINMLKNNDFNPKIIVLFSDGVPCCKPDEASYTPPPNPDSPVVEAKKEGIKIYTVAFGDYNLTGFKNLSDMSNYTGGSTYLISDTKSVKSTPLAIYNDIINNNKTPKIFNLTSNLSSPQELGTRIEWIADANDPENDTIYYQFWLNGNSTCGNWTTSNSWIWNTSEADVGDNQIQVCVRDNLHEYVYDTETRNFTINPAINLMPNPSSPQDAGIRIEWTAVALGLENNTTRYQFWLNGNSTRGNWTNMTEWTTSNTWIWSTSEADVGDNQIRVSVRDDLHEDVYDTETRNFTINPAVYLTSNLSSPQNAGTWIEWTADVLGLENSTTRYQFWLNGNSTSGNWKEMTEWTENKSWIWNTSEDDVGDNQIQVRVRDNLHEDVDDSDTENFTIKSIDDDGEETIKTESDSTDYSIELRSSGIKLIRGNWSHEDNETNVIVTKEISVSNGTSTDIKITIEMPNQTNPSPRKINAVFALDTSGSMRKYYRNDANESAEMVQAWSRFDNVSIVSWDHKHETLSGPIPVAENEDQLASILDNLADRCSEKDLTYYDEGLNGSLAILRNRSAEPVGPEKIIIFLTGFGEFKPGDHLDEYVNEAKESGYKIFAIGVEIDETSNTSKDQYLVLKNMSESTGGEFYNMSSFNSEELNDIMAKITAEFPNDSIDSSPARNVVATDTLFPYLIVNDSNSSNIAASKGNVTAKTNPDETTTLTWNVGDMNLNESVTMTIHTTFDLTLPADVGRDNKWICYKADETTPESEVAYNWLVDGTWNRRFIEIPAGEIRVTQESTPLATPINSFDIWRS